MFSVFRAQVHFVPPALWSFILFLPPGDSRHRLLTCCASGTSFGQLPCTGELRLTAGACYTVISTRFPPDIGARSRALHLCFMNC